MGKFVWILLFHSGCALHLRSSRRWQKPCCGLCTVLCVFSTLLFKRFSLLQRARVRKMCQQPESHTGNSRSLGIPVEEHKIKDPACCMTFLGIEIDTNKGCLRLLENKLQRLCELLRDSRTSEPVRSASCYRWSVYCTMPPPSLGLVGCLFGS